MGCICFLFACIFPWSWDLAKEGRGKGRGRGKEEKGKKGKKGKKRKKEESLEKEQYLPIGIFYICQGGKPFSIDSFIQFSYMVMKEQIFWIIGIKACLKPVIWSRNTIKYIFICSPAVKCKYEWQRRMDLNHLIWETLLQQTFYHNSCNCSFCQQDIYMTV